MVPETGRVDHPKALVTGDGRTGVAEAASPSSSNSAETGMAEGCGGGAGTACGAELDLLARAEIGGEVGKERSEMMPVAAEEEDERRAGRISISSHEQR
jgi:hypothetical protein